MMRQVQSHFILSLSFFIFTYSSFLLDATAVIANSNGRTNPDGDAEVIAAAVVAAAQKAEALRARLQSHVEAQVNKILSEKNAQAGGGGGGTQKLELKIDLPPDLAALVNNEGGAALKIHQFGRKEESDLEDVTVTLDSPPPSKDESDGASSATPCPLGMYSNTGFATDNSECEVCPEGQTTIRLGSDSCEVVTQEDLLGMFYDLLNGDMWSEHQRRGWKSELPTCQWEGVYCDDKGEINGMAFPIIGLNSDLDNVWYEGSQV